MAKTAVDVDQDRFQLVNEVPEGAPGGGQDIYRQFNICQEVTDDSEWNAIGIKEEVERHCGDNVIKMRG